MSHISVPGSRIGTQAPFKRSFRSYSKKECGLSGPYKDQEVLISLKTCTKDISGHLNGCYKTTSEGVKVEWKLCLLRVGLFGEVGDSFAIHPHQRDEFGLGWRPSKACKYPSYTCQLFLAQRRGFFILGEPVFSNTTRLYPKISEDVPNNPKVPKKIIMLHMDLHKSEILGKVSSFTHYS